MAAINKLKINKCLGEEDVVAELLIYQMKLNTNGWLDDWTKSVYMPIDKKGQKDICSNYRTKALTSHASKVTLEIISESIKPYQLPPEQLGFVPRL